MTLNQIRYFHMIAESESMGQAAKHLYISQPSLSISMNHLEEELDVTLFDRIGHHIRLTREGEIFLGYANQILDDVEKARRHMSLLSKSHDKILRLGCIEPAFNQYVPYIMRKFLDIPENADIQFELSTDSTAELVRKLQDGSLDLLISSVSEDSTVSQMPLYTMPLALLGAKQSSAGSTKAAAGNLFPSSWNEIAMLPLIGYSIGSSMDNLLTRVATAEHVTLRYVFRAPNEGAITALVYHGFGYSIVPITDTLASNTDIILHPLPGNYRQTIYLTKLSDRYYRGASARFISFMEQLASGAPPG